MLTMIRKMISLNPDQRSPFLRYRERNSPRAETHAANRTACNATNRNRTAGFRKHLQSYFSKTWNFQKKKRNFSKFSSKIWEWIWSAPGLCGPDPPLQRSPECPSAKKKKHFPKFKFPYIFRSFHLKNKG